MDFMKISTRSVKQGVTEIFPKFILKKSSDLMIRGGDFYAVWREDLGLWSTEEQDVIDMVDQELYKFTEERRKTATDSLVTKYMWDSDSGSIDSWHKYCQKRMRDNFHPLDEKIIFGDTETTKTDYASKKLSYPLRECDISGYESIKHEAWDEVDKMLDGKLKPYIQRVKDGELTSKDLANALKTAINSVYGLTSATFSNPFHDVRNKDNIVAKRGALFMVDLKHEVQKRGFTVAHIKTDSIKIPDATPEIIKFVMDFGKKYGYTFEHEATYDRMCLVNNAVYIAKYKDPEGCEALYGYAPGDNKKHKNDPWTATGKQFAVPYVFKTCFSKEPTTINDMRETFSVKSALYLDMNEKLPDVSEYEKRLEKLESDYKKGKISDTTFEPEAAVLQEQINDGHNRQFVGKVGEFCPIKPGCGGGLLVREQNGKFYAATGTTGYRWLESEQFLKKADEDVEVIDPETGEKKKIAGAEIINGNNDDIIDRSFYDALVNDAIEAISKYGDYEWFVSDDPYIAKEKPLPDFMNIPDGYALYSMMLDEYVELLSIRIFREYKTSILKHYIKDKYL